MRKAALERNTRNEEEGAEMTLATTDRNDVRSIRATARWAGVLNLLSAIPDGFSVTVLRKVVDTLDASVTATNILGAEGVFRLGFVADLVSLVFFVASAVLLYQVFRPASRRAALLFLVLIALGTICQALEAVHDLAALVLLKGGPGLSGLPTAQARVMALVFLRLHSCTYLVGLFFYGCSSLVMGALVLRSTFLPRVIGALMMIDGMGFLTLSLVSFLSPLLATHLYPYIPFVTAAIGEGSLYFWLIIRSVNGERWLEQAAADRAVLAPR